MLQPNGSISVFDSLTRLLSYITACLRFGIYTSTSKVKTLLCCLSPPLQVTLEKVLGITASGNCGLACDPRSGLVAYPAG